MILDSYEAMATPAAKKARVEEPKSFHTLAVDEMTLKIIRGQNDKFYIALLDDALIRFVLTPDEPTRITWGFDMDGTTDKRAYHTGTKTRQRKPFNPSRTWQRTGRVPREGGREDEESIWHRGDV